MPSMAVGTKDDRTKNDMEFPTEGLPAAGLAAGELSAEKLAAGELAAEKYPTEEFSAAADILKPSKVRTVCKIRKRA